MKYKKCNASDKICRNQNICCTKGCLIGKLDPSDIMENTTKEAAERKTGNYWVFTHSSWHIGFYTEVDKKWRLGRYPTEFFRDSDFNEIKETRIETWEPRLTQFEEMKRALKKITQMSAGDSYFDTFIDMKQIAAKTLASLSETNEKP